MERGFSVPVHLRDLELESPGYTVAKDVAEGGVPTGAKAQQQAVAALETRLEDEGVLSVFDDLYVLVRDAAALDESARSKLARLGVSPLFVVAVEELVGVLCRATAIASVDDALKAGASGDAGAMMKGRGAYVMACYLAHAGILAAEAAARATKASGSKKKKTTAKVSTKEGEEAGTWSKARPLALAAFGEALGAVDVRWLWSLGVCDDAFLLLWLKVGVVVLNDPAAVQKGAKEAAFRLVAGPYARGPPEFACLAAAAIVEDLVLFTDAAASDRCVGAERAAEACAFIAENGYYDPGGGCRGDARFCGDILRELTRVAPAEAASVDSKASKCVATFVDRLGEKAPAVALAHVSSIKEYLDAPAHALRSAVIGTLAHALEADALKRRQQPGAAPADKDDDDDDDDTEKEEEEEEKGAAPAAAAAAAASSSSSKVDDADDGSGDTPAAKSGIMSAQTRDALWDLVSERVRDISPFTRAATLRALASLVVLHAVPNDRYLDVTAAAVGRLRDRAALARKAALALLARAVEHNPYGHKLDPEPFEAGVPRAQAQLAELDEEASANKDDEDDEEDADVVKKRAKVELELEYHLNGSMFIRQVEKAAPDALRLLRSMTPSDAVEAAKLFGSLKAFGLPCAVAGLRAVLPLACSSNDNVKNEAARVVASALGVDEAQAAVPAHRLCELVATCGPTELGCLEELASAGERANDEAAAASSSESSGLPRLASPRVVRALWTVATNEPANRVAAMNALALACSARGPAAIDSAALSDIVAANLEDPEFFDCALGAAVASVLRCATDDGRPFHAEATEAALPVLATLRRGLAIAPLNPAAWYACCDATLVATFRLDAEPERDAADLLANLARRAGFGGGGGGGGESSSKAAPEVEAAEAAKLFHAVGHTALQLVATAEDLGAALKKACAEEKDRDDMAEKDTTSLDQQAPPEGDGAAKEEEGELEKEHVEQTDADHDMRIAAIIEEDVVSKSDAIGAYGAVVAKVVLDALPRGDDASSASSVAAPAGAVVVPPELARAAALCLSKLCCVSRAFCDEHIALVVTTLAKAHDAWARVNVAVALGDLAARQPNSVEPWTEHVYAALRDENRAVRSTVLTTLAHLALNDMIKAKGGGMSEVALRLVDDDLAIQKRARSFFDELARKKTEHHSPIYNVLPDIISRLSMLRRRAVTHSLSSRPTLDPIAVDGQQGEKNEAELFSSPEDDAELSSPQDEAELREVDAKAESPSEEEAEHSTAKVGEEPLSAGEFQKILGFLLKFVDKEKHVEALAEKLCQRIAGTRADDDNVAGADGVDVQAEARRDFAFCLSKLALSEKVARRLHDLTHLYKDALLDDQVHATFAAMAAKAAKLPTKTDGFADAVADWTRRLDAHHDGQDPDADAPPKPPPSAKKPARGPRGAAAAKKTRNTRKKKKTADDDGNADDDDEPRPTQAAPRRAARAATKKAVVDDSDDDDENEPPSNKPASSRAGRATGRA